MSLISPPLQKNGQFVSFFKSSYNIPSHCLPPYTSQTKWTQHQLKVSPISQFTPHKKLRIYLMESAGKCLYLEISESNLKWTGKDFSRLSLYLHWLCFYFISHNRFIDFKSIVVRVPCKIIKIWVLTFILLTPSPDFSFTSFFRSNLPYHLFRLNIILITLHSLVLSNTLGRFIYTTRWDQSLHDVGTNTEQQPECVLPTRRCSTSGHDVLKTYNELQARA